MKLCLIAVLYSIGMAIAIAPVQAAERNELPSLESWNLQASGAENFNPDLKVRPPQPPPPPIPKPDPTAIETEKEPPPRAVLKTIQTDFKSEQDNFGQGNRFLESTAQFSLPHDQQLLLKTGINSFVFPDTESVMNIPFQIGWEGKVGDLKLQTTVGVDIFDRLPTAVNLHLNAEMPLSPSLKLSAIVDQAPYKLNAKVLDNRISAWRYGPNLFWQLDPHTSLFSMYRWGNYSDRNTEQQSFSRLERKLGQFSIAANLFSWRYRQDMQERKGYFSPPDFLVYNGELAWEGNVLEILRCRLMGSLGNQRLSGVWTAGNRYEAHCSVKVSPTIDADLGYTFSTVRNRDVGSNNQNNQTITGQIRFNF
jgi:hypothetical protein